MAIEDFLLDLESRFEDLSPGQVIEIDSVDETFVSFLQGHYQGKANIIYEKNNENNNYSVGILKRNFGGNKNA
jgi:hypothetical protein